MPKSREHKNARDRARRKLNKISGKTHKRVKKSSGDLVAIQIAVVFEKRPKGFKFTRELLEDMIREKAKTSSGEWSHTAQAVIGAVEGVTPPGMKLQIIRWKNPDRLADEDAGWRYADPDSPSEQADAWGSLRRIIQNAPSLQIGIVRNAGGKK